MQSRAHGLAHRERRLVAHAARIAAIIFLSVYGQHHLNASEPDDPEASTAPLNYEPVLRGYEHLEIVTKPDDWRTANDLAEELDGPRGQTLPEGEKPRRKSP